MIISSGLIRYNLDPLKIKSTKRLIYPKHKNNQRMKKGSLYDANSGLLVFALLLLAPFVFYGTTYDSNYNSDNQISSNIPISGHAAVVIQACTNPDYCGDLNCDGYTDVADAQMAAQHSAGQARLIDIDRGDIDNSGSVDINDALRIAQFSGGMASTLNCRAGILPARRVSGGTTGGTSPGTGTGTGGGGSGGTTGGSGGTSRLCSTNSNCNYPNEVCANGLCQACYQNVQCNAGNVCVSGLCRRPIMPPQPTQLLEACRDGIDNDGDGRIDHSSVNSVNPDVHCASANDNLEQFSGDRTVDRLMFGSFDTRTNFPIQTNLISKNGASQSASLVYNFQYPSSSLPSSVSFNGRYQGISYLSGAPSLIRETNTLGQQTAIYGIIYVAGNKVSRVRSRSGVIAGPDLYLISRDASNRITSVSNVGISNVQYYLNTDKVISMRIGTGGIAKDYTFNYNFADKISSMQIDRGGVSTTNTYEYDSQNRLARAVKGSETYIFHRFSDGRISKITGNFGAVWFNYDSQNRLTEIFNVNYDVIGDPVIMKELMSKTNFDIPVLDMVWLNKVCSQKGLLGSFISAYNLYGNQAGPSTEQARTFVDLACRNI